MANTTVTARVRPNGAYARYLAYGTMDAEGRFIRKGYPKDILKPQYGDSWGSRHGNSYEYDVSFEVPNDFSWHIVLIYQETNVQNRGVHVLYAPQGA